MAIKNDSSHSFGGVTLTISALSYFAEDLEVTDPSETIEIPGTNDEIVGQISIDRVPTLTATIQLAGQAVPAKYTEFTYDGLTWYISELGKPRAVGEIVKVSISARKKLT